MIPTQPRTKAGKALLNGHYPSGIRFKEQMREYLLRSTIAIEEEAVSEYRELLQTIYDESRMWGTRADGSGGPGVCRWCDAPSPDEDHDHDFACPAAKAQALLQEVSA